MSKIVSILALVAGLGLAVAIHSAPQTQTLPQTLTLTPLAPPPQLPGLSDRAATIDQGWPGADELSKMLPGCAAACNSRQYRTLAPWEAQPPLPPLPDMTDQPAEKPASAHLLPARPAVLRSQQPQAGSPQPMTLDRLRSVPQQFAAQPLAISAGANQDVSGPPLALAPTPEPESWMMFIAGRLAVGRQLRRRPHSERRARG